MMYMTKKRIVISLTTIVFAALTVWMALDPNARENVHNLYQRTLVVMKLTSPVAEGATFWCPMHPEIRRRAPSTCPICNMALVPLEGTSVVQESGVFNLSDRQVQQAGVRIATLARRNLAREIDATGRMDVNHHRHRTITSWIPGRSRIQRLHVHFTGELISADQVMAEMYNPTLVTSIEEYHIAVEAYKAIRENGAAEAIQSAQRIVDASRERLLRFGLSDRQVREITQKPQNASAIPTIPILAPFSGTLLQPAGIKEGGYVEEGEVLFHVADLSSLWLFVDVYEYELPFVSVGQKVEVSTRAHPGSIFEGEISFIEPLVQERTRTVRLRCVIENKERKLSPGMYARVLLRSLLPKRLAVPESAVLQSGRRDVVIVSEGDGRYRPKLVKVGLRYLYPDVTGATPGGNEAFSADERYHEVIAGLSEGDRVVVAGNFLLNAEAQFQGAVKKMLDAADAMDRAPRMPNEVLGAIDEILTGYLRVQAALVTDRLKEIATPAREIHRLADEVKKYLPETAPTAIKGVFDRIEDASVTLFTTKDIKEARKSFGIISREVIAYLRDFAPDRVAGGEFYLFRCPMVDEFGFDLWIQKQKEIANPYMGQMMPKCGVPASLK